MRISYVVVTGFLGSGKTTLLRIIARDASAHNKRVAFIVNDLAEIDVDGATLDAERGELSTVVRLSSGCICCTIRGEFEAAMTQIIEQFDHGHGLIGRPVRIDQQFKALSDAGRRMVEFHDVLRVPLRFLALAAARS